jgi:hypothetical protein
MSNTRKTNAQTTKSKLSTAAIGGITVGVVSGFILLGVLAFFFISRKRNFLRLDDDPVGSAPYPNKPKRESLMLTPQKKPT